MTDGGLKTIETISVSPGEMTHQRYYRLAFRLAIFTVVYNLAEGVLSVIFGERQGSLALFGFGVDSFIEVVSGLGIVRMVLRIEQSPESERGRFEQTALRVTGISFYALVCGLVVSSIYKLVSGEKPETTVAGIILSLISIGVMYGLMKSKLWVGEKLKSRPIIADAHCTKVCIYMSVVLLAASGLYEFTRLGFVDILGSLGLAYLSFNEGRECFEQARNPVCACSDGKAAH